MDALVALFVPWFFLLSLGAACVTTVVVWIKRGKFPLLYSLLIVVIFLTFSFFLVLNHRSAGPQPVGETDAADLTIQTFLFNLPAVRGQTIQVNVTIYMRGQVPTSTGSTPQPNVGLTPVGTLGVPIIKAFGPGYNVSAVVQLNASSFDVSPQGQQEQSLDQYTSVTFIWTVTPKSTGNPAR